LHFPHVHVTPDEFDGFFSHNRAIDKHCLPYFLCSTFWNQKI